VVEAVKEDGMAGKCMLRKTERMTNGAVLNDMTPYHSEAAVMIEEEGEDGKLQCSCIHCICILMEDQIASLSSSIHIHHHINAVPHCVLITCINFSSLGLAVMMMMMMMYGWMAPVIFNFCLPIRRRRG